MKADSCCTVHFLRTEVGIVSRVGIAPAMSFDSRRVLSRRVTHENVSTGSLNGNGFQGVIVSSMTHEAPYSTLIVLHSRWGIEQADVMVIGRWKLSGAG